MDLRVLGPVEARDGDQPVAIGAGKPRALLAMLALSEGSPVSADQLIDGLWGEAPPATAPKMVQGYVSHLRKAFATAGNGAEIVTRGRSYELRLGDGGDLDVRRFERLVAAGTPRDALALWRGPPLDDVAAEPFAPLEIRRLEELRLAAVEQAIAQDLAAGRNAGVIGELDALVTREPLRERLHGLRMLALYRSGRQAAALHAYRHARTVLVEAIGVEPGPELRRLHDAILRQDPALDLPAELPPELDTATPLVGRERELDALRRAWRRGGRFVLAGPAGIGKTRLAAELAAEVQAKGGRVVYASGAAAADAAREEIGSARRPILLVAEEALLLEGPQLVLVTLEVATGANLTLGPLDTAAVAAIAREYGDDAPLARLVEESEGVPLRVHRAARGWARAEAARELDATADRAAGDRARFQAAEDDLAAGIVALQS